MAWEAIEREINQIPGNELVLEKLLKLLDEGEAIAFVGAGASAPVWPLWRGFLTEFIEYSLKAGKLTEDEAQFLEGEADNEPLETAQQLRNKLGVRLYFDFIRQSFGDKHCQQTYGDFTPTHQYLLQLPIQNYVTLNYDAGLTNARGFLYPRATTSYFFWDQEEAHQILDNTKFKRLVLHAHGRYDRADSVILTLNDYQRAYEHNPYLRTLNSLFADKPLLLIGFGLKDPYIKQLSSRISADFKTLPMKHIALLGLEDEQAAVTGMLREKVESIYRAHILFYPAHNNHEALGRWLGALTERFTGHQDARTTAEPAPLQVSPIVQRLADAYIHQPTNDENYKGRQADFATLNRWAMDPTTRTIAVCGIGGQGKTAMAGQWLKQERAQDSARMPVFYWSFYEDMDVEKFLQEAVRFIAPAIKMQTRKGEEIDALGLILGAIQKMRILMALDGLEVMQQEEVAPAAAPGAAGTPTSGHILHPVLSELLTYWVRAPHQGLMILTSRFEFPQLERFAGTSYRRLSLPGLTSEDGVALLEKLGIFGHPQALQRQVENLNGHPLGLRILASAVKMACFGDLSQFEAKSLLELARNDPLSIKLSHLLAFYRDQLKDGLPELLGIISLFKRPIAKEALWALIGRMESLRKTRLAKITEPEMALKLKELTRDFLVDEIREGVTCHPVIRDYFRSEVRVYSRSWFRVKDSRVEVADFLSKRPGGERPANISEVRDLVEAVQLLCEAGNFKAAHDLKNSRLDEGGYGFNIFRHLPAPAEGLECSLAFVRNEARQGQVEAELGKDWLATYFGNVGFYHSLMGNLNEALVWWKKNLKIGRSLNQKDQVAFALHEMANIETHLGNLMGAVKRLEEAISLSGEVRDLENLSTEFARKAYTDFLMGNLREAHHGFELALAYEQKARPDERFLYSLEGNQQCELFICSALGQAFKEANDYNIEKCTKNGWNRDLANCFQLMGWWDIRKGNLKEAKKALAKADAIYRKAGLLRDLCRLEWAWGMLAAVEGDYQGGLRCANESLTISSDRGMMLWKADGLCLRGRLKLLQLEKEGGVSLSGVDGVNPMIIMKFFRPSFSV
ncbi:MAG: SIR2 family protein [bacterium]|nr:SIR2 family protein [bacterium]